MSMGWLEWINDINNSDLIDYIDFYFQRTILDIDSYQYITLC